MPYNFQEDDEGSWLLVTSLGRKSKPEVPVYGLANTQQDCLDYDNNLDEATADDIIKKLQRSEYYEGKIAKTNPVPTDELDAEAHKHFGAYIRRVLSEQTEIDDFR